jgi:ABC-type glycerol-3-phosphate transport system substrate-binding protein
MNRPIRGLAAVLVAAGLLSAACGNDGGSNASTTTTEGATTTGTGTGTGINLDTNGDGKVVMAVATPGPRNDGGYYQSLVDGVTKFSKDNGYKAPIIVDNIRTAEASTPSTPRSSGTATAAPAGQRCPT